MTELSKALILAKMTGATLIIAKLDRFSRNAAFLLTLRDSRVKLLAVDMPEANDLTVGIMALVEWAEREAISRRTKEALAVSKVRGVKLGNHNGRPSGGLEGRCVAGAAVLTNAEAHAQDLALVVSDIRTGGVASLRAMAEQLTAHGC